MTYEDWALMNAWSLTDEEGHEDWYAWYAWYPHVYQRPQRPRPDMPPGPPPRRVPQRPYQQPGRQFRVDPGAIRFCRRRWTYVWLRNQRGFWIWIIQVFPNSIVGYTWPPRGVVGIDLNRIESFVCA